MSKAMDKLAPLAAAAIGSAVLPGIGTALGASIGSAGGAAIGSGLYTGLKTKNPLAALAAAGGSYAGNTIGGHLFPSAGSVGQNVFKALPGGTLTNFAQNAIPASIANTSISSALGGYFGGNVATDAVLGDDENSQVASSGPAPFRASQQQEQDLPGSLSGFASLAPNQTSTNIATQGVYGGGSGPQERDYFLNLINRRLVDEQGNTDQDFNDLAPIEMSYLDMLGLGGHQNVSSLLEAIAGYHA